jgi:hypothetical protein
MIASLDDCAGLKSGDEVTLHAFELFFDLARTAFQTEEQNQFGLSDRLLRGEWNNCGFLRRNCGWYDLRSHCESPPFVWLGLPGSCKLRGGPLFLLHRFLQVRINRHPNQRAHCRPGYVRKLSELGPLIFPEIDIRTLHGQHRTPICVQWQSRKKSEAPGNVGGLEI